MAPEGISYLRGSAWASTTARRASTARRRTCTRTAVATSIGDDGGSGLGRARLSPWYDAGMTWDMCLFVFVCVLSSGCIVCRPSELCVCRVECINKIGVP